MGLSPENSNPERGDSPENKEEYQHSLRATLLGGSINKEQSGDLQPYKELGSILSKEGVVLSTGPILENSYIGKVTDQFIEEEKVQSQIRKGVSSPRLLEFIPARRTGWVAEAKGAAAGAKNVQTVEGGVPLLTAVLERPQTGLFIFCPPSETSGGTLAEAIQAIAHMEVVIKTNEAAAQDEEKAKAYPILPKAVFIGWPEKDRQTIEEAVQRSQILTPPAEPQKYADLFTFLNAEELPSVLPATIKEQTEKFNNWFKTHGYT